MGELFFIMSSLWQHQFYCLFGFLTVVVAILAITCAEMSITLTYFQLTMEDYNWWWCSFTASASCGFYVFLYSIWYFHSRLAIDRMVSAILYFGYMFLSHFLRSSHRVHRCDLDILFRQGHLRFHQDRLMHLSHAELKRTENNFTIGCDLAGKVLLQRPPRVNRNSSQITGKIKSVHVVASQQKFASSCWRGEVVLIG